MNRFLLPRLALLVVTAALAVLGQPGGPARLAAGALPALSAAGALAAATRRAEADRTQADRVLAGMLRAARGESLAATAGGRDEESGRMPLLPWLAATPPDGAPRLVSPLCGMAGHGAASGLASCRSPTGPPVA